MSAQPQPWADSLPHTNRNDVERADNRQRATRCDIALQVVINADVRRVFHAVSIPEYREAWLCAPDGDGRCCAVAAETDDCYRIEFYREDTLELSVRGSYQMCRPDEIVFTWQQDNGSGISPSIVRIHLQGDSIRSVLNLRHSGFTSSVDHLWHQRMWHRSLEKLAWLLERCHP